MMTSNVVSRARALLDAGRLPEGIELLRASAARNEPDALIFLANMCLAGNEVKRDLTLSRELFRKASAAGSVTGAEAYRAFVANGTGAPADWKEAMRLLEQAAARDPSADRELQLIADMSLTETGDPASNFVSVPVSASPEALSFPGLFSERECDFLIDTAMPALEPSNVFDPETGEQRPNPVRTSDAAGFPLVAEKPAIHALCRRLAAASGTHVAQGEPLQVLRYRPGQEYRPHFDAINNADNQRTFTFLVYLNEDFEGGETCFLTPDIKVKGGKGDGLLFRNADSAGRLDPNSRHAGLPVTAGEKFLASRWIRARPLEY